MRLSGLFCTLFLLIALISCGKANTSASSTEHDNPNDILLAITDGIKEIISDYDAEIGAAVIINDRDTLCVNDKSIYPMMSVFKLHQGIALCDNFKRTGLNVDSVLIIKRDELNPNTWSPMLKEHPENLIKISVKELLRYAITQSDNNSSNLLFNRLVSKEETDSMIATLIPRSEFKITFTEEEMFNDHSKAYSNYTSPRGAAELINRLMTESILTTEYRDLIVNALKDCKTGQDRIIKPLLNEKGVTVAHKTGSGFRNEQGILAAHNDLAYISLPDGQHYSLAVFVKDIRGDETLASEAIAKISTLVYTKLRPHLTKNVNAGVADFISRQSP